MINISPVKAYLCKVRRSIPHCGKDCSICCSRVVPHHRGDTVLDDEVDTATRQSPPYVTVSYAARAFPEAERSLSTLPCVNSQEMYPTSSLYEA